jgi:phosphatidylglycerophosphate synthase
MQAISGWYPVKAAAVFAAILVVVSARWRDHHPFPTFGLANLITTVRALFVALLAGLIGEVTHSAIAAGAVGIGAVATTLDGVDGWAARRTRSESPFGARFDMEVDALLVQVLSILVWQQDKAGAWVLLSGLMRYLFGVAGLIWPWLQRPVVPNIQRKAICIIQITGLLVALLPSVTPPASAFVAAAALAILSYSFLVDTVWLWQRR